MKILAILRTTPNRYFLHLIDAVNAIGQREKTGVVMQRITLEKYLSINQDEYDVLIYNPFPDETNLRKFNRKLIKKCDEKFYFCKGLQILLDTHDNGTIDGFARFNNPLFPRIKVNPSYNMIDKMNIIMTIPYIVYPIYQRPQIERPFKIVCAMRTKNMPFVRQNTYSRIKRFNPINDWLRMTAHAKRLCKTLINVVPTGTGDSSLSHTDTLAAGALLLAEENISNIKILPFADLRDGENFVSYNFDNICDKLDSLLRNYDHIDTIRNAGLETFKTGYDYNRSAYQLLHWIEANIKK